MVEYIGRKEKVVQRWKKLPSCSFKFNIERVVWGKLGLIGIGEFRIIQEGQF